MDLCLPVPGGRPAAAPPARTFVAVGSWPFAADIEIEAIALA